MKPEANSAMLRQSVMSPPILYISTGVQLHANKPAMASQISQARARSRKGARGTRMLASSRACSGASAVTDIPTPVAGKRGPNAAVRAQSLRFPARPFSLQSGDALAELVEFLLQLGELGGLVGLRQAGVGFHLGERLVDLHLPNGQELIVVGLLEGSPLQPGQDLPFAFVAAAITEDEVGDL